MRMLRLSPLLLALSLYAAEPFPQWDGRESVADYAQRVKLPATKSLDLGNGVTLDLVLIPAGQFIMGTAEPDKPTITVYSGQVRIGIGAGLSLLLLVLMLVRNRAGRRFSFSLRGLLAFSLACSVMVWGGTRWYQALEQIREYDAALARYNAADSREKPGHPVRISKPFYLGKYTVTQAQYEALTGTNPSGFKGAQLPVETVSWDDAQDFCLKLTARLQGQALEARLPTEEEWEYACRAGTRKQFYWADPDNDLDAVAWYVANNGGTTHPVGMKKANAFGVYDMHGNVCQWCQDTYAENYEKLNATDPMNNVAGASRAVRGSSCRISTLPDTPPGYRNTFIGFRVVVPSSRTPP
ncbi:MAG: formylglycine-generating enzyme family protein [Planctomycetota bacterium]